MICIYGIKNCTSVRKAMTFFKNQDIEYSFFDFKKDSCGGDKIKSWVERVGIDIVLNKKSATYKNLGLSKINLSNDELLTQMSENNLIIKRPVIEYGDEVLIGFDEDRYKNIF